MLSRGQQGKLRQMGRHFLFEDSFKHFTTNRRKADGFEYIWVCFVGCFCSWDNEGVAPVIRNL